MPEGVVFLQNRFPTSKASLEPQPHWLSCLLQQEASDFSNIWIKLQSLPAVPPQKSKSKEQSSELQTPQNCLKRERTLFWPGCCSETGKRSRSHETLNAFFLKKSLFQLLAFITLSKTISRSSPFDLWKLPCFTILSFPHLQFQCAVIVFSSRKVLHWGLLRQLCFIADTEWAVTDCTVPGSLYTFSTKKRKPLTCWLQRRAITLLLILEP